MAGVEPGREVGVDRQPRRGGRDLSLEGRAGHDHLPLEHLDRPRLIVWSGRTLGIRAIHVWRLEARNGKTLARTEESYDGLVARVLRRSLQKMLDTALTDGAGYLKAEAEKPPGAS